MTILEFLRLNNYTVKEVASDLQVDPSTFSKIIRGKYPLGLSLYKKIKTSYLKDCTLDNLIYTKELNKLFRDSEHKNDVTEVNRVDLNLRLTNRDKKESNTIIDITRDLPEEIEDKTDKIKKLIDENKKLFRINFKYAMQLQNALDCLDDLEIQIQILRNIINRDKYLQELQNMK